MALLYNLHMVMKVFTDGGSKGNPGPSSIGIVFYLDGKNVFLHHEAIGVATNNDAEYTALIRALEFLTKDYKNKGVERIEFYSDSRLMVNQVNGLFKVKNGKIREYVFKIRGLEQELKIPLTYSYVPREKNKEADLLVNTT